MFRTTRSCGAREPQACPVRVLEALRGRAERCGLAVSGAAPVFTSSGLRSGELTGARLGAAWVGRIVRKRAAAAGIPLEGLSAHSLRAGLLTSAGLAGVPMCRLLEHSRHARSDTLDLYIRGARRLASHPAEGLLVLLPGGKGGEPRATPGSVRRNAVTLDESRKPGGFRGRSWLFFAICGSARQDGVELA